MGWWGGWRSRSQRTEIEQFRRLLLSSVGAWRSKDEDELGNRRLTVDDTNDQPQEKLVCVTSGVSFLGLAIVNQLLVRGYFVRIIVDNEGEEFFLLVFFCFIFVLFDLFFGWRKGIKGNLKIRQQIVCIIFFCYWQTSHLWNPVSFCSDSCREQAKV